MIFGYPMEWFGYVWGIVAVISFFYFSNSFYKNSRRLNDTTFEKNVFVISFVIRGGYVLLSYWFYVEMTDTPFEFSAADSSTYDNGAKYLVEHISEQGLSYIISYVFGISFSDAGFYVCLMIIYFIVGKSILLSRIVICTFGAYMCVLVYRIAKRHYSEEQARMSAIFCMLCPYLIFYCGLHLKEVIMTFFTVLFINSADSIILESKKWQRWIPLVLSGIAMFSFRTVLGAVAVISFFVTLLFSRGKQIGWGKRLLIFAATIGVCYFVASDKITQELQDTWTEKDKVQQVSMEWRSKRKGGNEFAKYASATVFAPLIFTIPFPSMVYTEGQENMRLTNGANYVKNITSFFTIFAIVFLIFSGDWRKNVLILSFTCGYLIVIAFSSFAQSGRFHVPVMPFEMMLAAYGISVIEKKQRKFYNMWLVLMFVACIGWQWFKLAGRGMI